ncbi:MAG TPA: hypothetical protein VKA06_02370, partial [Spirochaetia bacterium]|nr:hypothetical protein [Spirochaetia bacterium]
FVSALDECLDEESSLATHPWRGLEAAVLSQFDREDILTRLRTVREAIEQLQSAVERLRVEFGIGSEFTMRGTQRAVELLSVIDEEVDRHVWLSVSRVLKAGALDDLSNYVAALSEKAELERQLEGLFDGHSAWPASAAVEEAIGRLRATVASLANEMPSTLDGCAEVARSRGESLERLRRLEELVAQMMRHLQLDVTVDRSTVEALLLARRLIEGVPSSVLERRSDRVGDITNQKRIETAAAREARLHKRYEELNAILHIDFSLEARDLQADAETLRRTGVFGRVFGGRFRKAKQRAVALIRTSGLSREAIADSLSGLADFLAEWRDHRKALGRLGVDVERTGFGEPYARELLAASQFMGFVQTDLAGLESGRMVLREFLLRSPAASVRELAGPSLSPVIAEIESLLEGLDDYLGPGQSHSLTSTIEDLDSSVAGLRDAVSRADELGLRPTAPLDGEVTPGELVQRLRQSKTVSLESCGSRIS